MGELWVEPVRVSALPNAADHPLWAALAFGSPLVDDMADADMTTLARLGRAVSPVTSYLAIEPGVRPSTEGLLDSERMSNVVVEGRTYAFGCGAEVSGRGPFLDRQGYLEQVLKAEYRRCGGTLGAYSVELETTRDEVVSGGARAGTASKASDLSSIDRSFIRYVSARIRCSAEQQPNPRVCCFVRNQARGYP